MSAGVGVPPVPQFAVPGAVSTARSDDWILAGGLRFDLLFTFVCFFSALGLFMDVYAHSQGLAPVEGWSSPYHYVLGGAWLAVLLLLIATFFANRITDHASENAEPTGGWRWWLDIRRPFAKWLPRGYDVTLLGVVIYGVGLVGDFIWHQTLPLDRSVEALFSPTHLLLLVGAAFFRTGPLRSAWLRPDSETVPGWRGLWPAIMSASYLLFALMVFTIYVSPFGLTAAAQNFTRVGAGPTAAGDMTQPLDWVLVVGLSGMFLHMTIVMGIVLLLVQRWGTRLPPGTFTFLLTLTTTAIVFVRGDCPEFAINPCDLFLSTGILPLVAVAFGAGMVADVLLYLFKPSARRVWWFRAYATTVPIAFSLLYFTALYLTAGGTWWSVQTWGGMILIPGALGYVMSFLVLEPPSGAALPPPHEVATPA